MSDDPEPVGPRPFRDWLGDQRSGQCHAELTSGLAELIDAVYEVGKPGTLTLTIKVAPAGRGGYTVTVQDDIKVKRPEATRDTTLFFIDAKNRSLTRRDPYQSELPLVEVPRNTTGNLKEAK